MGGARILLVGPHVSRLGQFVEEHGYDPVSREDGQDAVAYLGEQSCELIVLELDLGSMVAREFMKAAREHHPGAAFLLVEDPAKAHRIVSAMVHGVFAFVAAPPDDDIFFNVVRRLIAAAPPEDELVMKERIEELELEVRALKAERKQKSGNRADDRTRDVFADGGSDEFDEPSFDEKDIAVVVHEQKTRAIDAEFEKLATQMMPAQKRVRGSEDYRRVVESVWSHLPDTDPANGA